MFQRFTVLVFIFLFLAANAFGAASVPTNYDSYLSAINAPGAWNAGFTGAGVTVGIIDDSFQASHPYLTGRVNSALSYNFGYRTTNENTNPSPYWDNSELNFTKDGNSYKYHLNGDQHGISTSGCVGAFSSTDNVYGPAYGATLAGLRIDFYSQSYPDGDISKNCFTDALEYQNGTISIKNNSYGISIGYANSATNLTEIRRGIDAITNAANSGTILVFSAGNERIEEISNCSDSNKKSRQANPGVITVAATGGTSSSSIIINTRISAVTVRTFS